MIDFNEPVYNPDPARAEREARDRAIAEGRAAYQNYSPLKSCPPFRNHDLTISWRMGWRWEKEDWERRKQRHDALAQGLVVRTPETH